MQSSYSCMNVGIYVQKHISRTLPINYKITSMSYKYALFICTIIRVVLMVYHKEDKVIRH